MPTVRVIEPISDKVQAETGQRPTKLRVAAYARVSTEQDEQESSYEAQVDFYTRHISNNPEWELVGVFADKGITGTNIKNRESFKRMVDMALGGQIDLILTKSISRFARNTVDTLQTVRKLKAAGVEVIFEKENLRTFDPKCEVMLTIMSSLAQEESRSISENIRWGKQKSMQDGNVSLPYKSFLGYRKGKDGRPEIVEEEAKIVREIYQMFLDGKTIRNIAVSLTNHGIPTPKGKQVWSVSTIRSILTNEKYMGDALLQKTYTVDYLTKEVRKNNGEVKQFLVEQSHEPIIDPETFAEVQEKLKQHIAIRTKVRSGHPFSHCIICGDCGEFYGHKVWHNNREPYDVWYCNHRYSNAEKCLTPTLREDEIMAAFVTALSEAGTPHAEYSEALWRETVEFVTVYQDQRMEFHFKDGTEAEVHL